MNSLVEIAAASPDRVNVCRDAIRNQLLIVCRLTRYKRGRHGSRPLCTLLQATVEACTVKT